ncbi:unnamed protein product [Periconia digitata]|uniref:Uncharacterized protein n=1 Tax=Periconia digitata TaxID=1303443 RepID=A0A9W4UAH8_9PLEO|nr:unnamed protein product [Periconia digitata]
MLEVLIALSSPTVPANDGFSTAHDRILVDNHVSRSIDVIGLDLFMCLFILLVDPIFALLAFAYQFLQTYLGTYSSECAERLNVDFEGFVTRR